MEIGCVNDVSINGIVSSCLKTCFQMILQIQNAYYMICVLKSGFKIMSIVKISIRKQGRQ